ncbi:respirasome Complex Assembly Factor 1-like [Branchiostoma floridae]|uniref:Respirasome Complex Assembly Factor 1-like n=1 Tax=Branchiostoma floridae TaxID=7739 RepID=C3YGI4_BRAFL|nr:respirasome Complex Assembly Factor 1-like [Branchiostoma floridae]|eukprot:XP_002604694.1 hypothetical protein BRAFLDRAFT_127441 [Branchiostoma floridae]
MTTRRRKKDGDDTANGALPSVWTRAFKASSEWPDKDEFLDVIYWYRQVIALIAGCIWGLIPLKGFIGLALFVALNAGIMYLYFSSFQEVDEEEYGGAWEITKEGFMSSFALFLVTWILFYSAMHFP